MPPWDLERYLPLYRLMARQLRIDPRLRARFDESDVVGRAMLAAVARLVQFRGVSEGELVRWLQEVFHTSFLDMLREAWVQKRSPDLEEARAATHESSVRLDRLLAAPGPSPSRLAEGHEILLRFAAAVETLPPAQRDAVILSDLHGATLKEIAEHLGRTEKAANGLLHRGRIALRAAFPDYKGAPQ